MNFNISEFPKTGKFSESLSSLQEGMFQSGGSFYAMSHPLTFCSWAHPLTGYTVLF